MTSSDSLGSGNDSEVGSDSLVTSSYSLGSGDDFEVG